MRADLPDVLRRIAGKLEQLARRSPSEAAARAGDRLRRDLLPRTAGRVQYLVAGIVGPNNSGKSSLFNALAGRRLSPSLPVGGATRRLVGAARPELLEQLRAEPTLGRFRFLPLEGGDSALGAHGEPSDLLVEPIPEMPAGLLIIDTPDFDSILEGNRLASESLLAVADLAVAVVTRHSYQNKEVVEFLRRWLAHGRPWMLVYNEAPSEKVVREHAAKLGADVGSAPLEVFWAPHSMAVAAGRESLDPVALQGSGDAAGKLREELFELRNVDRLKAHSLAASISQLRDDLDTVARELSLEAASASGMLETAERRARKAAHEIASAGMPGGPFIDAFRAVLDRRSNPVSRAGRGALRKLRIALEKLPGLLGARPQPAEQTSLERLESAALDRSWAEYWEEVARDLGRESRHPGKQATASELAASLDGDLAPERGAAALADARTALKVSQAEIADFQVQCEQLVEQALERKDNVWLLQAATDVILLAPAPVAALIVFKTGGLGSDVAVGAAGAVTSALFEKISHLLGSEVWKSAQAQWQSAREERITALLLEAALPQSALELARIRDNEGAAAEELRRLSAQLS